MSTNEFQNSSDNENLCVVCFKSVEIYSIGVCDHAVCFECSTRMRVLCRQNECPICRQDLPKVIFTKKVEPFAVLYPRYERSNLQERRFGVFFCTSDTQKAYYRLLEHRCQICDETERKWPFKTFQQLKDHMRREHELFYCDICTENLKIFSFERKSYNRQELAHHRRKGDKDNTSHRGHPLCEFCDTRFMDSDELFRHLRRNHLFCHFCDADGKHQYYNSMDDLKRHFQEEHYFCEEGECKTMPLTAVFRTEIDLKAHITTEHLRYMSKSATKQARTLELEFTLAPRPRMENTRSKRYNDRRDRSEEDNAAGPNMEPGGPGGGSDGQPRLFVNPLTSQDFPALGNAPTANNITLSSRNFNKLTHAPFRGDDFPSLGASSGRTSSAVSITTNSISSSNNRAPEVTITRTVRNQQGLNKTKENFPALGGTGANSLAGSSTVRLSVNSNSQDSKAPKVSIHVNHKPNGAITTHITTSASSSSPRPTEAFPSLGNSTTVPQPQWVQPKSKKKNEAKSAKAAPCPQLPPSDLSSFPTLSKGKGNENLKKTSSVTVPVSNSWVNLNNINSSSRSNNSNSNSNKRNEVSRPPSSTDSQLDLENQLDKLKLVQCQNVKNKSNIKEENLKHEESKSKNKKKKSKNSAEANDKAQESDKKDCKSDSKNTYDESSSTKNGLIKKRSELKIGTLSNTGESSNISSEYPVLGATKPPPGFTVKPPPGFNNTNFPSLDVSTDLTFTSSSGQRYSIIPTNNYRQPPNFQVRNQNLIKKFMDILNDNYAIKEFKKFSDLFRNGSLPAEKFYEHCKEILRDSFEDIFPELLVLLPDISKQQELYKIHSGKSKKNLVVCENCNQVIFKKELTEHYNYHALDNHFPSLNTAQQTNNVWKK